MKGESPDDIVDVVTADQKSRAFAPDTLETSDFFAPFFDVVFYRTETDKTVDQDNQSVDQDGVATAPGFVRGDIKTSRDLGYYSTPGKSSSKFRITSRGGEEVSYIANDSAKETRHYRSSLTVEAKSSAAYKVTLVLQPPLKDALYLLDNAAIRYGSLMEIQWGYMGQGSSPVISDKGLFTITQPSVSFGQQVSIQIVGYDLISQGTRSLERHCAFPREQYKTDLHIINAILKQHGKKLVNYENLSTKSKVVQKRPGQHIVQSTTDEVFLRRMLLENNVCIYPVSGNDVGIEDKTDREMADPSYRLLYFTAPESSTDIPLISFETNALPSLFAAKGSRGVLSFIPDLDTGEDGRKDSPVNISNDDGTPIYDGQNTGTATGAQASSGAKDSSKQAASPYKEVKKDKNCVSGKIVIYPKRVANADKVQEAEPIEIQRTANTQANATIPGHPTIVPLMNVDVVGVGVFSDWYRVLKVVHEVSSGYVTKLTLFRVAKRAGGSAKKPSPQVKNFPPLLNMFRSDFGDGQTKIKLW